MAYANVEKKRLADRRYREANREKIQARYRRWAEENIDKVQHYRTQHSAKTRARVLRWQKENPELAASKDARRRALKANAPQGDPTETAAYERILRNGICEICGSKGPVEIDHIEALSKGGAHDWMNMAGLCKPCNASKGDKTLLHFLLDRLPDSAVT